MSEKIHFEQEIDLCTISIEGFKVLAPKILNAFQKGTHEFQCVLLEKVSAIIAPKNTPPSKKFYALYLLLKSTDLADAAFFEKLAKTEDLMNFVGRTAQCDSIKKISADERGALLFSQRPSRTEARIGVNVVRLCAESLFHWHQTCDENNPSHPCYIFSFFVTLLRKRALVPSYYHFLGRNYSLSQDLATWNFGDKLPLSVQESPDKAKAKRMTTKKGTSGSEKRSMGHSQSREFTEESNVTEEELSDTESILSEERDIILPQQIASHEPSMLSGVERSQKRTSSLFLETIDPTYRSNADNLMSSPQRVGKMNPMELIKEVAQDRQTTITNMRYNKLMSLLELSESKPEEVPLKKVSSMPTVVGQLQPFGLSTNNLTSLGEIKEECIKENKQDNKPKIPYDKLNSGHKSSKSRPIIVFANDGLSEDDQAAPSSGRTLKTQYSQDKVSNELLAIQNSILKCQPQTVKPHLTYANSLPETNEKFMRKDIRSLTSVSDREAERVHPSNAIQLDHPNFASTSRKLTTQVSFGLPESDSSQPTYSSLSTQKEGSIPSLTGQVQDTRDLFAKDGRRHTVQVTSLGEIMDSTAKKGTQGGYTISVVHARSEVDEKKLLEERETRKKKLMALCAASMQKEAQESRQNGLLQRAWSEAEPSFPKVGARQEKEESGRYNGYQSLKVVDIREEERYVRSKERHESERVEMSKTSKKKLEQESARDRVRGLISLISNTSSAWCEEDEDSRRY